ncbi:MAG: 30S ribosome-binding factor RbfA [Lentimicrobiaceae bacterium]|nr:30S ribosome-binding factor RbfA [Lentimicrobiaceae bacterium]
METTRQHKIARLLQKELAEILQTEGRNFSASGMVTVTSAEVSKDFSFARIYLSIFGVGDKQSVLRELNTHKKELRFRLGQRIKNQLRIVPEIHFMLDETLDYIENIDKLLKQ